MERLLERRSKMMEQIKAARDALPYIDRNYHAEAERIRLMEENLIRLDQKIALLQKIDRAVSMNSRNHALLEECKEWILGH